jgi:hypothetical protein
VSSRTPLSIETTVKFCYVCTKNKPESEFYDYYLTKRKSPKCKECVRSQVRSRYRTLRENGLCNDCASPVDTTKHRVCAPCRERRRRQYRKDIDHKRAYGRELKLKRKIEAYNAYGGCFCACCGDTHLEFLSIDHIDGKGAEHRRSIVKEAGWRCKSVHMPNWLKKNGYPPGFQVLCMNCKV